ncbi:MAG TPA: hypothetical protein VHY37_11280 [Tepidisphaeraceae bacterium]|nr:hypothetical protein [Tepidisphaeraceae bacterium]
MNGGSAILKRSWPASLIAQYPILEIHLSVIRRRLLLVGLGVCFCWGLAAALGVLICGAWLDLALDFSGEVRALIDLAAIFGMIGLGTYWLMRSFRAASAIRIAEKVDDAAGAKGEITAGLDLALSPPHTESEVTSGLARLATRRAVTLMGNVRAEQAAPTSPLRIPGITLAAFFFFVALVGIILPRLFTCQSLRFLQPFADHPPYSPLTFSVDPGDSSVIYGDALDVRATVGGALTDHVDLIYAPLGQPELTIPMFPDGEGKWLATLADVENPGKYFLRSGRARSVRFNLAVITVPQIQKVTFHVTLPSYTNRPPYDGPMPQSGISGLAGTQVVVHAESNRPLSGGHLEVTTASGLAKSSMSASGNDADGSFQIDAAGKFQFKLTDTDGQESPQAFTGTISLLQDQKPIVRITEPMETSFATPQAQIKVTAVAEDDYGLTRLDIYRGLNDSRFRAVEISLPSPAPTEYPGTTMLTLSDYGLAAGDTIKLFARTEDNDPAGPKGAESKIVTIHIVSQQDMDRMMMARNAMETLQSKYADAARRLEALNAQAQRLSKELQGENPNTPLTDQQRKELRQLTDDLKNAANEVDKLASHDLPVDIDKTLDAQLREMSGQIRQASDLAKQSLSLPAGGALDKLQALQKKLGNEKKNFDEKATQPLEYLAKILPLMQDEAHFVYIYQSQKDLADRLAPLQSDINKNNPDVNTRMRDLQDEQRQLQDALQTVLTDIDNHADALPADPKLDDLRKTAKDFAQAVRASLADREMQDAASDLDPQYQYAGTQSYAAARAAEQTLSQFIHRCQSMGGGAAQCLRFQPTLSQGLGNSLNQLLASAAGGFGIGTGSGGYSEMADSLANVGLYGTIPLLSQESRGGGGQAQRGMATAANGSPNGQQNPDAGGGEGQLQASGGSDAPVPPQYKKRVSDYFQRVEDELSQ